MTTKTTAAANKPIRLLARHSHEVEQFGPIPSLDENETHKIRLAMRLAGESPGNDAAVLAYANGPAPILAKLLKPIVELAAAEPTPKFNTDGSAKVGKYKIRPLIGRDLFRFGEMSQLQVAMTMTNLTEEQVLELPYEVYSAIGTAIAFLNAACLREAGWLRN